MMKYDCKYDYIISGDLIDDIREHQNDVHVEKNKIFIDTEYPVWINFYPNGNILVKVVIEFADGDTYEIDKRQLYFEDFVELFEDIYGITRSIDELLKMDIEERARYLYYLAKKSGKRLTPEYEKFIIQNSFYSYLYSRDIIQDRWLEAEPSIIKDNEVSLEYLGFLKKIRKLPKFKVIFQD